MELHGLAAQGQSAARSLSRNQETEIYRSAQDMVELLVALRWALRETIQCR